MTQTPEEKLVNATTRVLEFWKDYKAGFSAEMLVEKYRWVIEYDDLLERFVRLYFDKMALASKVEGALKVLSK